MRAWRKIFALVVALAAAIFAAANLLLYNINAPENGRPHRVEINRLALEIEESGLENVDLSQCEFVYNIAEFSEDFYDAQGDYSIREINGGASGSLILCAGKDPASVRAADKCSL